MKKKCLSKKNLSFGEIKKGFVGILVGMIIAVFVLAVMYVWYQKISTESLQKKIKKASQDAGVYIDVEGTSPQAQVNSVRDMMNKIQDKRNSEFENEMK